MKIDIDLNLLESLLSLATVIEARDEYTGGHTWRVSKYAEHLAKRHGLDDDGIFVVKIGGLVHDIGKVGVPDAILNKPGPLSQDEYASMKKHPVIGEKVIERHPLAPLVMRAVMEHHERIDGKGYPEQPAELSVYGKIISIADAFDAMTSTRPYRDGMSMEKALSIVEENKGTQFDPELAEQFMELAKAGKLAHIMGHANDTHAMATCPGCGPIIALPSSIKDGEHVGCPHCHGDYVVHKSTNKLEVEWTHKAIGSWESMPDWDAVGSVLAFAKKTVSI